MLEAVNVHKIYRQPSSELRVLKGIDVRITQGEVVAIVGPSGAGKSTLLHILGGLDKPSDGKVLFEQKDLYRINDRQRANIRNRAYGFIFQFYHLLPEFSALENVILPGLVDNEKVSMADLKAKGGDLLERVGLGSRQQHKPNELSGGEQQRVAIARALINDPRVIFCDEPTGNLDSENGEVIIQLLLEMNARRGQTLVIVTHDEEIARRSQRILYMRDGKMTEPHEQRAAHSVV